MHGFDCLTYALDQTFYACKCNCETTVYSIWDFWGCHSPTAVWDPKCSSKKVNNLKTKDVKLCLFSFVTLKSCKDFIQLF